MPIYVRIGPAYGFTEVRAAALAFAREVERRAAGAATTTCWRKDWWRKDRGPTTVFVDYNQNARDHTMAAAYSIRGVPAATVSTPITWDEVEMVEPADRTMATVPRRFRELGDLHAGIDDAAFSIDKLIEWSARDERAVVVDAGGTDDGGRPRAAEGVEHTRDRLVLDPGAGSIDPRPARGSVPVRPGRRRFPA